METEILQIIQALLQCVERHSKDSENKDWLIKLFQNSLTSQNTTEIDSELIYNVTFLENILANILAIDIKTIVKIRMIQKIIWVTWEENQWDTSMFNNYIFNENPTRNTNIQPNLEENNNQTDQDKRLINNKPDNDQIITLQQNNQNNILITTQQKQLIERPDEELIEEINMEDREQVNSTNKNDNTDQTETNNLEYQYDTSANIILGEDISTISHYNIRNRKNNPANPFFITKESNYKLGTLSVNVPGNDKKEQHAFVANMLKLPSNSELINSEFINGNLWITANFEHEEDLIFCKDKIDKKNKKNKDLLDLIQLSNKTTINKAQPEKSLKFIKKQNSTNKYTTKLVNKKTQNKYKITDKKTIYKGGVLTKNIPGDNRKEKIDFLAKILDLDPNDNPIFILKYKDNDWMTTHFNELADLNKCIKEINNKYKSNNIQFKKLPTEQGTEKDNHNKLPEGKIAFITTDTEQQTYRIKDIPKEYSINRIKGALKPYGKVIEISTISSIDQKNEKEIQVTIESNKNFRNLKELWSIPIGSVMTRVARIEEYPEVWERRRQYSARLYGLPKNTDVVLLMRSIKNLKPKTCYIPKCSRTRKERSFTIVGFQTRKDLDKACISAARYFNSTLTWSKSRTQHIQSILNMSEKSYNTRSNSEASTKYTRKTKYTTKDNLNNLNHTNSSPCPTFSFLTTTPPASTKDEQLTVKKIKNDKGKEKMINKEETIGESSGTNTTDKLISLITQISSRLNYIEENMGLRPNRS